MSNQTKTVRLVDDGAVLELEDSPRLVEVPLTDNGHACECGCGCKERFYAIASSYCQWCQTGACDCSPSAMGNQSDDRTDRDRHFDECPYIVSGEWASSKQCAVCSYFNLTSRDY